MHVIGIITAVDAKAMKVRVQFPDKEGLVSPWLPMVSQFAQAHRCYHVPDLGEQVACLMDDNLEAGFVVGSLYGGSETPPEESGDVVAVHFSDGTIVRHDRASKTLTVQSAARVVVQAAEHIQLAAPTLDMSAVVGGWRFDDGSKIEYNEATKVLKLDSIGDLIMSALRLFAVNVPLLSFACSGKSDLQTGGPVTLNAGGSVTINAAGPINLNGAGVFANGKAIG